MSVLPSDRNFLVRVGEHVQERNEVRENPQDAVVHRLPPELEQGRLAESASRRDCWCIAPVMRFRLSDVQGDELLDQALDEVRQIETEHGAKRRKVLGAGCIQCGQCGGQVGIAEGRLGRDPEELLERLLGAVDLALDGVDRVGDGIDHVIERRPGGAPAPTAPTATVSVTAAVIGRRGTLEPGMKDRRVTGP